MATKNSKSFSYLAPPQRLERDRQEILKFYSPEAFEELKLVSSPNPEEVMKGIEALNTTSVKVLEDSVKLELSDEFKQKLKEGFVTLTLDTKKQGPLAWAQEKIDQFTTLARENGFLPRLKPEGPKPPAPPKPPVK